MKYLITFCLLLLFCRISAQPGNNDPTFNPGDSGYGNGDGANGSVYCTAVQSDGKILIGGAFTTYNGTNSIRIARLNSDGSYDNTFVVGTGFNNDIWAIAVQSDGKIIVGGYFTTYNGTAINRIIRLNSDGSRDNTFNVGTGVNSYILSAAIQSDGKVIVAGNFTTYNGTASNYITRINTDGTIDATFIPGTGANAQIQSLAIQTDGKIIIGGSFSSVSGTARNCIARLNSDGSHDTGFNPGTGAGNNILTTEIQSDGKIIIGGYFTTFNGTAKNRIARLNSNGSLDNTFNIGTGANNTVSSVAIQSDGKIVTGGDFITYNGISAVRVVRINSDGSIDNTFNAGTGANTYVSSVRLQADGKVIIGGFFTTYDGGPKVRIARANSDGSPDLTFNAGTGANSFIIAIAVQSDSKIIATGDFISYNGSEANRIVRINSDGSIDNSFVSGTGANALISAAALQSDGKIVIGGNFTTYNGSSRNYIARINSDGSLDNTFNVGTGANASVYAIAIQSDGKVLIAGNFSSYNGTARNRIVRINSDGSLDNTFSIGTGANAMITSMILQSDGKVLIGGNFNDYNGTSINRIARLNTNGSIDNTFSPGTGANAYVLTMAIQTDGKIIIGGTFTTYNSVTNNRIVRLNSNGSIDNTFNAGTGANNDIRAILIQSDGRVLIGGNFTTYNDISRNRIIRLNSDGSINTAFNVGTGANNYVRAIAIQSDLKILTGGEFTAYKATGRNRIARIYNCSDTFNSFTVTECDSYTAPDGMVHTSSGVKTAIIPNAALCDSVITINLTILNSTTSSLIVSECDSYTAPDGQIHTSSGIKTAIISNAAGCDSTITINLTINNSTVSTINETACDSYTAPDGQVYTNSGIKTAIIPNSAGCDSTITINLTVNYNNIASVSLTECDSYTAPDGQIYTSSGIKTAVIPNAAGCDSTITIDLTIKHSSTNSITVSQCETYTAPDLQVYNSSGIYTAIIPNSAGCDSVITIDLTILNNSTNSISQTACNSYTAPDGNEYTSSGIVTATIPNSAGCDSIITIDLTIISSTSNSFSQTACDSYTAPDGTVHTNSGLIIAVIPNSVGCDSTIIIDLAILNSSTGSLSVSECDSYTAPDGTVHTGSGIVTAIIPNSAGCDSTITIDLTITYSSANSITASACEYYTAPDNQTYINSGIITAIIPNSAGCDSIITIDLHVQNPFQNEEICLVTVDSVTNKNKIIWQPTSDAGTDFFNVYCEIAPNTYNLIATIPYGNPDFYIDNNSDPENYDTKYKISVVDSCGNESFKSYYHKTMKADISGYGNFANLSWTEYDDEGGNFIPAYYYIYRGLQTDNMSLLDSVSGSSTSYSDTAAFDIYYYKIAVKKSAACDTNGTIASFSNIVNNSLLVNVIYDDFINEEITVYPNPMTTSATIIVPNFEIRNPKSETGSSSNFVLRISDLSGKVVRNISIDESFNLQIEQSSIHQINSSSNLQIKIERGNLNPGIYFLEINADKIYRGKLVVE